MGTAYRGGNAKNLREEFAVYGLPVWFMYLVGTVKLLCAVFLLYGLFAPSIVPQAALALAVLMSGAIMMHVKVKDSVTKALPATVMLAFCLIVASAS